MLLKSINLTADQRQSSVHFSQTGLGQGQLARSRKISYYSKYRYQIRPDTLITNSFDYRRDVVKRLRDCVPIPSRMMNLFWNEAA